MAGTELKNLKVFVKEDGRGPKVCTLPVPVGAAYEDLLSAVGDVVLGPEDDRWVKVKEERKEDLDPTHGGGTINVKTTFEAHTPHLWSHPHDDCAPLYSVELHDVPPQLDVYRLLLSAGEQLNPSPPAANAQHTTSSIGPGEAGRSSGGGEGAAGGPTGSRPASETGGDPGHVSTSAPGPGQEGAGQGAPLYVPYTPAALDSEAALRAWWASMPRGRNNVLRPLALRRLVAKTGVPPAVREVVVEPPAEEGDDPRELVHVHGVPPSLRHKLNLEGVQGLWELASERAHVGRLGPKALAALVGTGGLRSNVPSVMAVAAATVWVLVAHAEPRAALVAAGVVPSLAHAASCAAKWRADWAEEQERLRHPPPPTPPPEADASVEAEPVVEKPKTLSLLDDDAAYKPRFASGGAPKLPANYISPAEAKLSAQAAVEAAAAAAAAALVAPAEGVVIELEVCNRVVYNCLGALGVLAVDGGARLAALTVSPKLSFLVDLATCSFPTPQPPAPSPSPVPEAAGAEGDEGAEGEGAAQPAEGGAADEGAAEAAQAGATSGDGEGEGEGEGPAAVVAEGAAPAEAGNGVEDRRGSGSGSVRSHGSNDNAAAGSGDGASAAAAEEAEEEEAVGHDVFAVTPEDSPAVHQRLAVEVLYAMLGRDRAVRSSLATAGGLPDLLSLTHSANGDVGAAAVYCLATYARDTGQQQDGSAGAKASGPAAWPGRDMLTSSGHALHVVHELMGLVDDLLELYCNGVMALGDGNAHPLLGVVEAACSALWGAVAAAVAEEAQDGQRGVLARIESVVAGRVGPQVITYGDTSRLARLAGQLVQLLCDAHEAAARQPLPTSTQHDGVASGEEEEEEEAVEEEGKQGVQDEQASVAGSERSHKTAKSHKSAKSTKSNKHVTVSVLPVQEEGGAAGAGGLGGAEGEHSRSEAGHTATTSATEALHGRGAPGWLAASLYGVLASLAAIHGSPLVLARTHAALTRMHVNHQQVAGDKDEARGALDAHLAAVALKRASSRFYFEDDDGDETQQLEDGVAALESEVHELERRIHALEEGLQAGAEESLAASQDVLKMLAPILAPPAPPPTQQMPGRARGAGVPSPPEPVPQRHLSGAAARRLGACCLAAAAVVGAMAGAGHPALHPTPQDPSPVFNGPFRPLLRDAHVLRDLTALARSPSIASSEGPLASATRMVVADAVAHLVATEDALPLGELSGMLEYLQSQAQYGAVLQYTSAAAWCLCRHESMRKGLLQDDAWVALLQRWLSHGLRGLRQHHALFYGVNGFYALPPNAEQMAAAEAAARAAAASEAGSALSDSNRFSKAASVRRGDDNANLRASGTGSVGGGGGGASVHGGGPGSVYDGSDGGYGGEGANSGPVPHGLLPQEAPHMIQPELYAQVHANDMSSMAADAAAAEHAAVVAARQVRFSLMAGWLLLRQWLVDNMSPMNTLTQADGLYVPSAASWWSLQFALDTPLALSHAASCGLSLLVEAAAALPDAAGTTCGALRELGLRCMWSLSATHPVVSSRLVALGSAHLAATTAVSPLAGSSLVGVSTNYVLHLAQSPPHVAALGGISQVALLLVGLVDRALRGAGQAGEGTDVGLLEHAVRGLARLGLSPEGRAALKSAKAVKRLVGVVRADSNALEAVLNARQAAGVPGWERPEELVAPLRAINALPIALSADQAAAAARLADKARAEEGLPPLSRSTSHAHDHHHHHGHSHSSISIDHDGTVQGDVNGEAGVNSVPADGFVRVHAAGSNRNGVNGHLHTEPGMETVAAGVAEEASGHVTGDAEAGLLALWALLNVSGCAPVQVSICKHGLYTLLRAVHRSMDPLRSSTAASVLANIHYHPDNATTLYKAELKLKYAALLALQGIEPSERVRLNKLPPGMSPEKMPPGIANRDPANNANSCSPRTPRPASAALRTSVRVANEQMAASMAALRSLEEGSPDASAKLVAASPRSPRAGLGFGPGASAQPTPRSARVPNISSLDMNSLAQWADGLAEPTDPTEEKAAMEAKMSFLRWVVDPSAAAFDELDALATSTAPRTGSLLADSVGLTQDELLARLTADPEEAAWLAFMEAASKLEGFHDARHAQGTYLRGTFSRSLAEGAASLWLGRSATKAKREAVVGSTDAGSTGAGGEGAVGSEASGVGSEPSGPAHNRGTVTPPLRGSPGPGGAGSSPGLARSPLHRLRPLTAPPARSASLRSGASSGTDGSPGRESPLQRGHAGSRLAAAGARGKSSRTSTSATAKPEPPRKKKVDPVDKAGCEMWRPHILAYIQDPEFKKPRVYLADRLLVASVPPKASDQLTDLTAKLFDNQVLRDGVRAMEDKAAAEAAALAAAEAAEAEEFARLEAEARVHDTVNFDDIGRASSAGGSGPAGGGSRAMSRGVSKAMARSMARSHSQAVSRAASRAASRMMSQKPSAEPTPRVTEFNAAAAGTANAGSRSAHVHGRGGAAEKAQAMRHDRSHGATGVRFTGASDNGEAQVDATAHTLAAAAAAVAAASDGGPAPRATTVQVGATRGTHSFIATSLVEVGALSQLRMGGKPGEARAGSAQAAGAKSPAVGRSPSLRRTSSSRRTTHDGEILTTTVASGALRTTPTPGATSHASRHGGAHSPAPPSSPGVPPLRIPTSSPSAHAPRAMTASPSTASRSGHAHAPGAHAPHHSHHPHAQSHHLHGGAAPEAEGPGGDTGAGSAPGSRPRSARDMGLEEVAELEGKWLGDDVRAALQRPATGYIRPHTGRATPAHIRLSTIKSAKALAMEAVLHPERVRPPGEPKLAPGVPRPTAALSASVDIVLLLAAASRGGVGGSVYEQEEAAKVRSELEAKVGGLQPLALRVATGDGGPDRLVRFPREMGHDARNMVMFEHVEGASYCDELYGHYLLPNGKLAHFVLGDTVRKGHKIDLVQPPLHPFDATDWLPAPAGGLPVSDVFSRDWGWLGGAGPGKHLLAPLWCPVPVLGPRPSQPVLEWDDGSSAGSGNAGRYGVPPAGGDGPALALRSVCISVTLERVTRVVEEVIEVPPKPKPKGKKKAGNGAGAANAAPNGRPSTAGPGQSSAGARASVTGAGRPASPAVGARVVARK